MHLWYLFGNPTCLHSQVIIFIKMDVHANRLPVRQPADGVTPISFLQLDTLVHQLSEAVCSVSPL